MKHQALLQNLIAKRDQVQKAIDQVNIGYIQHRMLVLQAEVPNFFEDEEYITLSLTELEYYHSVEYISKVNSIISRLKSC